ncbi:RAD9, HUS1, RAD1-interacting nuclear orphan protein 1-like [Xyrauchen texanus]|uniref:RAD9, HUS1, RAD1-interacting nuclear orphan protein 1-like n=1 Tax=Xyrauchen texanus TaxID=154827 RepID=UPI002241AAFB|nr:RAD9, HUS1, RAD1-interacting nuclear orphan protein 1-like [Xyrauchen texanus]
MPRTLRKKRLVNPHKSQLLFIEGPINGPKHDYGPQLRSAIHPRTFVSEKQRQNDALCTSWVSPQFNSLETKAVSRGRKIQMTTRCISNSTSVLSLPQQHRKTTVCKYPPLSFEESMPVAQQQCKNLHTKTALRVTKKVERLQNKSYRLVSSDNRKETLAETPRRIPSIQRGVDRMTATRVERSTKSRHTAVSKKMHFHPNSRGATEGYIHTPLSNGSQTPNTSSVPAPPNVETPEMAHCSSTSSPDVLHILFPQSQPKTPPHTLNTSILVKDTPEKDYGLKVTWRRRKALMKLLINKGQLLLTDAGVVNEWI